MKTLRLRLSQRLAVPVLLGALAIPCWAAAQDTTAPGQGQSAAAPGPGMGQGMGMGQMRGMKGKHCPMMRHGRGMPQMLHMPRLPPGNEKLQLQMEAEILQKIGEIQGKYANQLP